MNATPELRFLLQLAQAGLSRRAASLDPAGVAWPAFVATVERHRLAPFLHARAPAAVAASCPPDVARQIQFAAAQSLRRGLAQAAELFRLVDALAAAGVPAFTVKGAALAQQLHGHPGGRFAGDVDLVVARADVERADAVLHATGLRRTWPDFPLTPRQTRAYLAAKPDFEYVREHPTVPLRVELLWRLEGVGPAFGTTTLALAGRETRTLALPDHALYLLQHGARHAWFRLFWLVDIALLLERDNLDWAALLARARAGGSERALRQGVALAVELLGARLPPALAAAPAAPALLAEARRQIVRTPRPNETVREWARQLGYRLRLAPGIAAKWRVLAPHVFTPINWQVWRLPDRWFWLYYPATPFLWLWRYVRRS